MHSNERHKSAQNSQVVKFFHCAKQVPQDKPFALLAACEFDLRPPLKQHGAIGFMYVDDLGQCENHVFLLKNGVVYLITNHLHLSAATLIEVNSTEKSISDLLSDMFDWLEINPPKALVHEIHHEFDIARKNKTASANKQQAGDFLALDHQRREQRHEGAPLLLLGWTASSLCGSIHKSPKRASAMPLPM